MNQYVGNVFVVSRLGQLRNVQNFIKQFNAKKNVLIIQFSVIDGAILKNICELSDRSLYSEIIYVKLPQRPLRVTKKKNVKMYNTIKETIEYINQNYEFNNLFLCNADKWYSYYEKIKDEENLNYTLNLLEEGLTTYIVSSDPEYQEEPIIPINILDLKKTCKDIKKTFLKIFKEIRVFFVKILSLIVELVSLPFRTNFITIVKQFILKKTLEKKYQFSYITHFHEAFVCFPEKLEQNNFAIDDVKKLQFNLNKIDSKNFNEIDENYVLFINQKYINYKQHFDLIFKIFTEMGYRNVYIKLHPKEDKIAIINQINECLLTYPDLNVKVLNSFDSIPIEDVIYSFKFKKIIGLTSSSLLYCKELIKNIDIVSIAERYRELCYEKENHVNPRELKLFEKEYKNFCKFGAIDQFVFDENK